MKLKACDPRAAYPIVEAHKLAPRLAVPAAARYCLIQCMPPHNGLEPLIEAVGSALRRQFPGASIEHFMRRNFMIDDAAERSDLVHRADAAIVFAGPAATSVHVSWRYAAELEKAGMPLAVLVPEPLSATAQHEAQTTGAALRRVITPLDWQSDTTTLASAAIEALLAPLAAHETASGRVAPFPLSRYVSEGEREDIERAFLDMGLSDGLPIVIPTDEAVSRMLAGTSRPADDIVCATMRPEGLAVSVEKIAINAVMAGARPAHLPVILAAASLYGGIELESMTRSVNSFAFSHLINGPIAAELGICGGINALGPGNPANAVIARAIGLVLRNCGWQRMGVTATPAQGNAAGFTTFAENQAQSPWPPFHTSLGYANADNVISLFTGGLGIVGTYYYRDLRAVAEQLKHFDSNTGALLLVSAKRARELAEKGLGRTEVEHILWENATARLGDIRASGFYPMIKALIERGGDKPIWPHDYLTRDDEDIVPLYPRAGIRTAVVGGLVSSVMQVWNSTLQASCSIDAWR